jgi:hypothetical protein
MSHGPRQEKARRSVPAGLSACFLRMPVCTRVPLHRQQLISCIFLEGRSSTSAENAPKVAREVGHDLCDHQFRLFKGPQFLPVDGDRNIARSMPEPSGTPHPTKGALGFEQGTKRRGQKLWQWGWRSNI